MAVSIENTIFFAEPRGGTGTESTGIKQSERKLRLCPWTDERFLTAQFSKVLSAATAPAETVQHDFRNIVRVTASHFWESRFVRVEGFFPELPETNRALFWVVVEIFSNQADAIIVLSGGFTVRSDCFQRVSAGDRPRQSIAVVIGIDHFGPALPDVLFNAGFVVVQASSIAADLDREPTAVSGLVGQKLFLVRCAHKNAMPRIVARSAVVALSVKIGRCGQKRFAKFFAAAAGNAVRQYCQKFLDFNKPFPGNSLDSGLTGERFCTGIKFRFQR